MAFITVFGKCIEKSEAYMNGKPGGKKKGTPIEVVVVNTGDVIQLIESGVDLEVIKKEAFP